MRYTMKVIPIHSVKPHNNKNHQAYSRAVIQIKKNKQNTKHSKKVQRPR